MGVSLENSLKLINEGSKSNLVVELESKKINDQAFSIMDYLGYENIINNINYNTDWLELYKNMGNRNFSSFIHYFVSSNNIKFEKKEYFFNNIFSYNGSKGDIFELLSEGDLKFLAKYCLNRGLIQGRRKEYSYFLEYIEDDLLEFINSEDFSGPITPILFEGMSKEQIEKIILNKKFRSSLIYMLENGDIISNFDFSNKLQEQIIDIIFFEYKEITNFDGNVQNYGGPTYAKARMNEAMSILIFNNTSYYFNKLINLDQNLFRKTTQKTHQTAILWFLDNSQEENIDENLMKVFFQKMVKYVGIDNLKDNRSRGHNSYYKYFEKYYPEAFEEIDIEKTLSRNSYLQCDKKHLIDKLLKTDNWFEKLLNTSNAYLFNEVVLDEKILDKLLEESDENKIIDYILYIENKIGWVYLEDRKSFVKKILTKVKNKKDKKILEKILNNSNAKRFIHLYRSEFKNFNDIIKNENIKNILNSDYDVAKNANSFISLSQNIKNFTFEINLKDVNNDFINFIKELTEYEKIEKEYEKVNGEYKNVEKIKISYKDISNDFKKFNDIFDVEISDYKDFKKGNINFEILKVPDYSNNILGNFEVLCSKYNLEYNYSNFLEIEKNYNNYIGISKKTPKLLSDFLTENNNISEKIEFLDDFFNIFNILNTNKDKIPHFKKLQKYHGFNSTDDLEYYLNEDIQKKLIKQIEEDNDIVLTKDFNINEILNFMDVSGDIDLDNSNDNIFKKYSSFYHNMKLFHKYFDDFDIKQLIKFNGKTFEISPEISELVKDFGDQINKDLRLFFELFDNLDKQKVLDFFDFFNKLQIHRNIDGEIGHYADRDFINVVGDRNSLLDYDNLIIGNRAFLIRHLIQKAIDENDYDNLGKSIDNILRFANNFIYDYKILENNLNKVLIETDNFISEKLLEVFVFGFIDGYSQEKQKKSLVLPIKEAINNAKQITGIQFTSEDLKDDKVVKLIEMIGFGLINSNADINKRDSNNILEGTKIIEFFKKYPNYKGQEWEMDNIKAGGILENILKYIELSLNLVKEKDFGLDDLEELYSYDLSFYIINNNYKKYSNIYYGYFKESIIINSDSSNWDSVDLSSDLPVNFENFTDYMSDNEVLLELENDNGFKPEGNKPWTKAWFLEKPERKEYLKENNLQFFRKYGVLIGLYKFEGLKKGENIEMNTMSEKMGFKINIPLYVNIKEIYNDINIFLTAFDDSNIKDITNKKIKLLFGYVEEYGINFKYFLEDSKLIDSNTSIDVLINLLKHRIYPTNNITKFINKGGKIEDLITIKNTYIEQGKFSIKNELHIDLEYINFRYLIDIASNANIQVGKGYNEYRKLIGTNYDEELDNENEYKQAGYESYISSEFIELIKGKNKRINVFSNLSYGKVLTGALKQDLNNDSKINFKDTRIGSTETHSNLTYIKKDLFSKEDIKKLFLGDSIILDGTTNNSFPDSNIGYKNYFFVLNSVLFELTGDKLYYRTDVKGVKNNNEYLELFNYLKGVISRNGLLKNAKPFKFLHVSQNNNMSVKTRGYDRKQLDIYNDINQDYINIYFTDFVDREPKFGTQGYFDDRHITSFKIIQTKTGFNFVDVGFEKELKKYYLEFKEENSPIDYNFYID